MLQGFGVGSAVKIRTAAREPLFWYNHVDLIGLEDAAINGFVAQDLFNAEKLVVLADAVSTAE